MDRHFLVEACPVYHNMTRKECKDFRQEINRKMTARKKALNAMAAKSPLQSQTQQQRTHAKAVRQSGRQRISYCIAHSHRSRSLAINLKCAYEVIFL